MKRWIIWAGLGCALLGTYLLLGPTQIGGPVSYVVTSGSSMAPALDDGDLVVVRESRSYEVGDVVAYFNPTLGSPVLHRIIDISGERFVFKGDNSDRIDEFRPTRSDLIGKRWFTIAGGGTILRKALSPWTAAGLASLVALSITGSLGLRRRRGPGDAPTPTSGAADGIVPPTEKFRRAATVVAVLFGVSALGAFLSFRAPAEENVMNELSYQQVGRFDYRAATGTGDVYKGGLLSTGDPIYRSLVKSVRFTFAYGFVSEQEASIDGEANLRLRLSSPDGWSRVLVLAPRSTFAGSSATVSGDVSLRRLGGILTSVKEKTGFDPGLYTLEIVPHVVIEGSVAGRRLSESFEPPLTFTLDATKMQLAQADIDVEIASSVNPVAEGSVSVSGIRANRLSLFGIEVPVGTARLVTATATLLAALVLGVIGLWYRRAAASQTPGEEIFARYPDRFVAVRSFDRLLDLPSVEVTSIEGLIRMSDASGILILYVPEEPVDLFILEHGGIAYFFSTSNFPRKTRLVRSRRRDEEGLSVTGSLRLDETEKADAP